MFCFVLLFPPSLYKMPFSNEETLWQSSKQLLELQLPTFKGFHEVHLHETRAASGQDKGRALAASHFSTLQVCCRASSPAHGDIYLSKALQQTCYQFHKHCIEIVALTCKMQTLDLLPLVQSLQATGLLEWLCCSQLAPAVGSPP